MRKNSLKIDLPFDEAMRRAMQVAPKPLAPKKPKAKAKKKK
jgi:hypothetical protein